MKPRIKVTINSDASVYFGGQVNNIYEERFKIQKALVYQKRIV